MSFKFDRDRSRVEPILKSLFILVTQIDEKFTESLHNEYPPTLDSSETLEYLTDYEKCRSTLNQMRNQTISNIWPTYFSNDTESPNSQFASLMQGINETLFEYFFSCLTFFETSLRNLLLDYQSRLSTSTDNDKDKDNNEKEYTDSNSMDIDSTGNVCKSSNSKTKSKIVDSRIYSYLCDVANKNIDIISKFKQSCQTSRLEYIERRNIVKKILLNSNEVVTFPIYITNTSSQITKVLHDAKTYYTDIFENGNNTGSNGIDSGPSINTSIVNQIDLFTKTLSNFTSNQLDEINLQSYGLFVGGDLLASILTFKHSTLHSIQSRLDPNDEIAIDLFIVNCSTIDAQQKVNMFIRDIIRNESGGNQIESARYSIFDTEDKIILRSISSSTSSLDGGLSNNRVPIVIHKKVYRSLTELILLTDFDCASTYFDGVNVAYAERTNCAFRNMSNLISQETSSSSHPKISRYRDLGFTTTIFSSTAEYIAINKLNVLNERRVLYRTKEIYFSFLRANAFQGQVRTIPYLADKITFYYAGKDSAGLDIKSLPEFGGFYNRLDKLESMDYELISPICSSCKIQRQIDSNNINSSNNNNIESYICQQCDFALQFMVNRFCESNITNRHIVLVDIDENSDVEFLSVFFMCKFRVTVVTKYPYLIRKIMQPHISNSAHLFEIYYLDTSVIKGADKFTQWIHSESKYKIDAIIYNLTPISKIDYSLLDEKERVARSSFSSSLKRYIVNYNSIPSSPVSSATHSNGAPRLKLLNTLSDVDIANMQTTQMFTPIQIISQLAMLTSISSPHSLSNLGTTQSSYQYESLCFIFTNLSQLDPKRKYPTHLTNTFTDLIQSMSIQVFAKRIYVYDLNQLVGENETTSSHTILLNLYDVFVGNPPPPVNPNSLKMILPKK